MSKDTFKDRGFSEQKLALLASLLEKEGVPQAPRLPSWSALTPIRTGGTKLPLFCMHGAGGTVMMYRDLSRHLGDDQPFYGLQSQGLDGSCDPLTSIAEMAAVYVNDNESGLIDDIAVWLEKLAPRWPGYKHHQTGEDNADAHLKALLLHHETTLPVTNGRLDLGQWQRVFYAEFDGQRKKRVIVKVMGVEE